MSISPWAEFELKPEQIALLEGHRELLARWNQKLNLVSSIEDRHYLESLFLAKHLPQTSLRIVDVGSGAGFPGFPVAVVRPESQVTLIESHQRKAVFLRDVSRETPNVRVLAIRAEDVARDAAERFDWAISRAVRLSDIEKVLRRLAPNLALLTGEIEISCRKRIRLPWGERRYLVIA